MAVIKSKRIMFCSLAARLFSKAYNDFSGEKTTVTSITYEGRDAFCINVKDEDMLNVFIELVKSGEVKRSW